MPEAKITRDIPHDFSSAVLLLQALIANRKLLKSTLDDGVVSAAFRLIGEAAQAGEGDPRVQAVAILGKAAEISKPVAAFVLPLLTAGLRLPLPPVASWGTAEDRYYLAKGISVSSEPWITSYAASELARADVAERASREIWADIAVNRSENLARALDTVEQALSEDQRALGYGTDTASRKLNRIIIALRPFLPIADIPTGEGFGRTFSSLVSKAGGRSGPESRPLRQETALNILDLMIQMLRLRFSATLDSEVYQAAGTVLGWWRPARPPEVVNSCAERIAHIAMDSIHVLSRQGVFQRSLRQALVTAFGAELVNRIGVEMSSNDPSLDPKMSSWLARGQALNEPRSNLSVREVNETELDELIARLLLTLDEQEGGPQSLQLVADNIELLEPGNAATIRASAMRARLAGQWTQAISARRRLVLFGKRGDLVQYDAAVHETEDALELAAQARIKAPGVVKQQEDRPPRVILKVRVDKP